MRNSSLVEGSCAENVTGLKPAAEAVDVQVQEPFSSLGVSPQAWSDGSWFRLGVVGERSSGDEGES